MPPRHEWKHEISLSDLLELRHRLRTVAQLDCHAPNGSYRVRSLYFDTPSDTALREKINGINQREKFRIRCYNNDHNYIRLEKKSKQNSLCFKQSAPLTPEQTTLLLKGHLDWMDRHESPLIKELYSKMTCQLLQPKTIVEYTREPYVYPAGNVRITLDYHIATGLRCINFLDSDCVMVPVPNSPIILEVKWDAFLPDLIRSAVQLEDRRTTSYSKYAACRVYG